MKTKQDLKEKLIYIVEIILDVKKLVNDSYRMLMADSSEKFTLISRDSFLTRVRNSFEKLAVIELTKLYGSKSDNYRLDALLNDLLSNYKNSEWTHSISKVDLDDLLSHLNDDEMHSRKVKLKELRDQHYAHRDQNPKNNVHDIRFYYSDFAYLLRVAELIIDELMQKIFELPSSFKIYEGEDADNFLNSYLNKINP